MSSKHSKNRNNISWWKRQSAQIQIAIIGAISVIIVALIQQFGDDILIYIASIRAPSAPTTTIGFDNDFNAINGLYATDNSNTQHKYVVLTNGCLVGYDSSGKQVSKIVGTTETELEGSINLFILSDKEIVVDHIELELIKFAPIDTAKLSPIHAFVHAAGGGGQTPVDVIRLDRVSLIPNNSRYNVSFLNKQQHAFQLGADGSTGIKIPTTFSTPGSYQLRFIIHAHTYNRTIQPFVTDTRSINWIYTDKLDPTTVESDSDVTWQQCP